MKLQFYILLILKTINGFTDYGQYYFGNDREEAYKLFDQLKGDRNLPGDMLHIHLMETINEFPVKI